MTIYEINKQIEDFLVNHIDEETGEITDLNELEALEVAKTEKIENIALYLKNTMALAKSIREEKKALAERQAKREKKVESLQNLLNWVCEGNKFETSKVSVSYRKSERVVIDDLERLPAEYIRTKTTVEPDKTGIKKALKDGMELEGVHIEEVRNIQVK